MGFPCWDYRQEQAGRDLMRVKLMDCVFGLQVLFWSFFYVNELGPLRRDVEWTRKASVPFV